MTALSWALLCVVLSAGLALYWFALVVTGLMRSEEVS
jgi:hypothetical protein